MDEAAGAGALFLGPCFQYRRHFLYRRDAARVGGRAPVCGTSRTDCLLYYLQAFESHSRSTVIPPATFFSTGAGIPRKAASDLQRFLAANLDLRHER
ncbi:hypothetical protein SBDP1_1680014 [Syntrophobacter sp. SbD1]|nr:hypothetical protein SBDP1_1680014 [Syntrophobacter sp. SbD1]